MIKPSVSILINNYNYGRFLSEAIDSAINQDCGTVEVVVVDDGSSDNSRAIIASYGERIRVVLKTNGGQASAFNAGYQASGGDIVCFLDADDWFAPNKVTNIVKLFAEHPAYGWLAHGLMHVDSDHNPVTIRELTGVRPSSCESGDYRQVVRSGVDKNLPWLPATSGLCFKRETLQRILPVPLALRITADNYLKCAALMTSPLLGVNEKLAYQRIHGANAYSNIDRHDRRFRKISRHIARHIARGLYSLERDQSMSRRLAMRNLKQSFKDLDLVDMALSLKDALSYHVCRSPKVFVQTRGEL